MITYVQYFHNLLLIICHFNRNWTCPPCSKYKPTTKIRLMKLGDVQYLHEIKKNIYQRGIFFLIFLHEWKIEHLPEYVKKSWYENDDDNLPNLYPVEIYAFIKLRIGLCNVSIIYYYVFLFLLKILWRFMTLFLFIYFCCWCFHF